MRQDLAPKLVLFAWKLLRINESCTYDVFALVRLIRVAFHGFGFAVNATDNVTTPSLLIEAIPSLVVVAACCLVLSPRSLILLAFWRTEIMKV